MALAMILNRQRGRVKSTTIYIASGCIVGCFSSPRGRGAADRATPAKTGGKARTEPLSACQNDRIADWPPDNLLHIIENACPFSLNATPMVGGGDEREPISGRMRAVLHQGVATCL